VRRHRAIVYGVPAGASGWNLICTRLESASANRRLSRDRDRFVEALDVMKFICREFWTEVFRKPIDKLQTNNRVC
jgi:hypothetical protein